MKTIIAGSRNFYGYAVLEEMINVITWEITEVVSGGAKGVDKMGELWADDHNVPLIRFPAEWDKYGKAAGYIRNKQMAEYADALIAIQLQGSKGTANMITLAREMGLKVIVWEINEYEF